MHKRVKAYKHLDTKLIHAGEISPRVQGAVVMPIFQSAMYETAGEADYHDVRYIRLNNTPNHLVLHQKLAALESGEAAVVTSSGMAAITSTLLTVMSPGDHLLVQNCLYGGTHTFITQEFAKLGLNYDFIDLDQPYSWQEKRCTQTKAIYVETLSNPLLRVGDLQAVVNFAKKHQLISIIDNTFATPINFRPLEWGFDLSIHSATKYLNGHSDIVAGAVIGQKDLITQINHKIAHFGGSLDPHAAFLFYRGLKTLALRVRYQNESALKIASFLEQHPAVNQVNYPGLPSSLDYAKANKFLDGCGGVLSFELKGGVEAAKHFIQQQTLAVQAPSLGGLETLITRPATTSHVGMSQKERENLGITDGLIRIAVGIEATEDLIDDFTCSF